ncbi:MAG: hypothetical protein MRJ67_17830 [Nitrospirales bacterium]|nr:hypothetical protein [Nitrospirales bacterium]
MRLFILGWRKKLLYTPNLELITPPSRRQHATASEEEGSCRLTELRGDDQRKVASLNGARV